MPQAPVAVSTVTADRLARIGPPCDRITVGITFVEAMAADCTVVAAAHPESAASEVVGDAGFLPAPTVEAFADALDRALRGDRPTTGPVAAAEQYDWDPIAARTEHVYRSALDDR